MKWQFPKRKAASKKTLDFHVDSINKRSIQGWIWRPDAPAEHVVVELLSGEQVMAEATADIFRQDLLDAKKSDGRCAFSIKLPANLTTGGEHAFALRMRGHSEPFFTGLIDAPSAASPAAKPDFHLDSVDGQGVKGWVWKSGAPAERVVVELLSGEQVMAEAAADIFRQDLLDSKKGDGHCAFSIKFPAQLRDGRAHELSLRARGSAQPFHKIGARRLATPRHTIDRCTPAEVSGTCWIPENPQADITIEVLVHGVVLSSAKTDHLNGFSITPPWENLANALKNIGQKPAQTIDLAVRANGLEIRTETFEVLLADSGACPLSELYGQVGPICNGGSGSVSV